MKKILTGLFVIGVLIFGLYFISGGFYEKKPSAYVAISELEWDDTETRVEGYQSNIYKVHLETAEVADKFPVSDTVPYVLDMTIDRQNGELYVAGMDRHPGDIASASSKGIDVYNIKTGELIRSFDVNGTHPIDIYKLTSD